MRRMFVRTCLLMVSLSVIAGSAGAQTLVISPTHVFAWSPSSSEGQTFGTPPVPLVTNYQMNIFLKSVVMGAVEPTTPPALTINLGKPAVDATGNEVSAPIRPMIVPGVEYISFLHAVGSGGVSTPVGPIGPFGFPSPPSPAGAAVIR